MRVRRIVDLTHIVSPAIQVYPGDPAPTFTPHATVETDGFDLMRIDMGSQTGTHVDAPRHVRSGGAAIDAVPPENFVGRGVVLDVRARVGAGALVTADMWGGPAIGSGDIALVLTGWSRYFGTDRYFRASGPERRRVPVVARPRRPHGRNRRAERGSHGRRDARSAPRARRRGGDHLREPAQSRRDRLRGSARVLAADPVCGRRRGPGEGGRDADREVAVPHPGGREPSAENRPGYRPSAVVSEDKWSRVTAAAVTPSRSAMAS